MSRYCVYEGRDCEILPSAEKEIYDSGYQQGREDAIDSCIWRLETFCTINSYKGIPKGMIKELLEQLKEQKNG